MRVLSTPESPIVRLVVKGDLDAYSALRLRRRLYDIAFGDCQQLEVDLSEIRFVDATSIGILARAWRTAGQAVDLRLAAGPAFDLMAMRAKVSWVFATGPQDGFVHDAS